MTILFYVISLTGMILLPVILAVLLRRHYAVPWWLFCVGMLTFTISQLYHLPLNNWLTDIGVIGPVSADASGLLGTAILLGLSAGLSESLARAGGYWFIFRRLQRHRGDHIPGGRWQDGLMVGLGHGGIEAFGLVAVLLAASVSALWSLRGTDLSTLGMSPAELEQATYQLKMLKDAPWLAFVPLLERAIVLPLHVVLSLLVWTAFKRRQPGYFAAAVLYHSLVDAVSVYAGQFIESSLLLEGIVLLLVLPGFIWAWRSWPVGDSGSRRQVRDRRSLLYLFVTAVRKELAQMWRTKRFLVIVTVFLLFGLGSPLLAKFTPEMFRNLEGMEMFAEMIPEPTIADAMGQYIKNLTQFGFIIAVLIGMGAVAGEKERGTAAMILSKPLPRWAFLLSKFTAQSLVYGVSFLLASLGAYYYTMILFEPFTLGPFLFGNLLLWLWISVFAAVTILASTVANATGAAAGMALVGSVVLLLAGSLPKIGQFAPGGLVAWASQLGLADSVPANGGAIAANIAIIIVCLITAIAALETQEI